MRLEEPMESDLTEGSALSNFNESSSTLPKIGFGVVIPGLRKSQELRLG
jgi:hypothetical protein